MASRKLQSKKVTLVASASLPTEYGKFKICAFSNSIDKKEHVAIVKGNVAGKENVPVRIHSECLTGDVFHSLRCDCRAQLEAALKKISKLPRGVILYMRQEGRGIGLANKIKAYALQEKGFDTVQANILLGFPSDLRDYTAAAKMINALGIKSVALITNNPDKINKLLKEKIRIVKRIPHEFGRNKYNAHYLEIKRKKMSHIFTKH